MEAILGTVGEVVRTDSSDVRKMINGTTRTHIDLFSGIGGFALAARWAGVETVAFCEIEKYAQRVLRKNFPGIRILEDVRSFPATEFRQPWLITGGYPCQPFSQAGKRRGTEDDRHLWPEMFRIIRSSRPVWVLCENVAGHITMGLDEVISDLEGEEYSVQSFVIPAQAVDARHRRDRVWIVALNTDLKHERQIKKVSAWRTDSSGICHVGNSESLHGDECGKYSEPSERSIPESGKSGSKNSLAHANNAGRIEQRRSKSVQTEFVTAECGNRWLPEPDIRRVAHGIPNRVDRLKGLGNAIVPQVAYEIIKAMIEADESA